jgi:hypothetical protein
LLYLLIIKLMQKLAGRGFAELPIFIKQIVMKSLKGRFSRIVLTRIIPFFFLVLTASCSTVFFDTPQPADAGNLSHVPKKIQGKWKKTGRSEEATITIDNSSYHIISIEKYSIPKTRIDTSKRYRIDAGKIFLKDDNYTTGYPFTVSHDTLFYSVRSDDEIVLSDSVLLRRARNCYVLNLQRKNWWEIVFIQKKPDKKIYISYPFNYDVVEMKSRCKVVVMDSTKNDSTYFHAEFKKRDIEKVIPKSGGGVIYILKPDSTFETPN